MRQYTMTETNQIVEEKELAAIFCNQCGKEIRIPSSQQSLLQHDIAKAGVFSVNHSWGYGSQYDTEQHQFDLCENCYEQLIEGFKIKIKRE